MCDGFNFAKREEPPYIPLMPASLEISTQKIDAGWWKWRISINEELYENHKVVPWRKTQRSRRQFQFQLHCSEAFDPVPELHWFSRALLTNGDDDNVKIWEVNEEGRITVFKVWTLSCKLLQLQIEAMRDQVDYHYDLVVDRDAFISLLMKTYCDFGKQGGWGWYGDRVFEEDWNMEPERIIVDDGAKINSHSGT